jgi:lipid-A-disaccharide synthase
MARILICAGESSSDALGAELVEAIRLVRPDIEFSGLAGDQMRSLGVHLIADTKDATVIGFTAVVGAFPRLLMISAKLKRLLVTWRPDLVVTIDSPGLLLPIARRARQLGIPAVHWVSPQVWAWRPGRIPQIAASVDRLLALLPMEPSLYREVGLDVRLTGHPVLDRAAEAKKRAPSISSSTSAPLILLAPGSRSGEIKRHWPVMCAVANQVLQQLPSATFVVPVANSVDASSLSGLDVRFETDLLSAAIEADIALVASGTATLEVAAVGTPMVVIYKTNSLNWWLGKRLITGVRHLALTNIIADEMVSPEHLQQLDPTAICADLLSLLGPAGVRQKARLEKVMLRFGERGAATRAATAVVELLPPIDPTEVTTVP